MTPRRRPADGQLRPGAWVAEVTGLFDLASWPTGTRVIVRKERPHIGAQLRITDLDGHWITAFVTNTVCGQLSDLKLQHRRRARCADRIGGAKDTELANLQEAPPLETQTSTPATVHPSPPGRGPHRQTTAAAPGRHRTVHRARAGCPRRAEPADCKSTSRLRLSSATPVPTTQNPAGQWNRAPTRATSGEPLHPDALSGPTRNQHRQPGPSTRSRKIRANVGAIRTAKVATLAERYQVRVLTPGSGRFGLIKKLRQVAGIGLKEAEEVVDGKTTLKVGSVARGRYIAKIVNKAGGSATVTPVQASGGKLPEPSVPSPPVQVKAPAPAPVTPRRPTPTPARTLAGPTGSAPSAGASGRAAAAPIAPSATPVAPSAQPYQVRVLNPGSSKIGTMTALRQVTQLGRQEASDVVDGKVTLRVQDEARARYIAEIVNKAGGSASIAPAHVSGDRPRNSSAAAPTAAAAATPAQARKPEPSHDRAADAGLPSPSAARSREEARAAAIAGSFASQILATWTPPDGATQKIHRDMQGRRADVSTAAEELRQALLSRGIEQPYIGSGMTGATDVDRWLTEVADTTRRVRGSLPWTKVSRLARLKELQNEARLLLQLEKPLRDQLTQAGAGGVERQIEGALSRLMSTAGQAWDAALADNPRSANIDWWRPSWSAQRRPGVALNPTVCPVTARLQSIEASISVAAPAPSTRTFTATSTTSVAGLPHFQVAVDLDRDGGFITDDKRAIETAAVDLLGQLPGGRVKVDVIDPLQLGDSARFLYDLNEAGDRILADAVWTTTEQVGKVLVQLEEHITFVTQKYLKGRSSLTEYNIEAGEIAEPYRLLILYDFPAGFSRDGQHFDEEHLSRLQRLAAVGRRAGVYMFVHVPASGGARRHHLSALIHLSPNGLSLGSSMSTADAGSGDRATDPRIGSRHTGRVSRLAPFGAFISLPDGSEGLLHISQYQNVRLIAHDMDVEVQVQQIDDRGKISLGLPSTQTHDRSGPVARSRGATVSDVRLTWQVTAQEPPDERKRSALFAELLRNLQNGDTTKVDPGTLARLSQAKQSADIARGLTRESLTDVEDPSTWWRSSSADRLQLSFGRMGASDVARVEFNSALESSALVGGRTGSGKSFLLHALIMDAVTRYSPEELTLYLCDLKEGVEFKQYADALLPHARAIAVESNREFTVSLLEALDQEITERGALFKAKAGGTAVSIDQFRRDSGQTWPRVMTVIDEFHKLFEQDDRLARRAMQLLERVVKEGRAFGVHTILASQSLANVDASFKSLAGQIPYRLVLASSDNDSRLLLGEDNADAKLLTKPGEGILNAKGGARESNQRFQTAYWAPEQRQRVLHAMQDLAAQRGYDRRPHVFEGNAEVRASDYPAGILLGNGSGVAIPVGAPMSMAPPVVTSFERGPGSNLLVVDVDGLGALAVVVTSLLAQGVEVTAIDFSSIEPAWEEVFDSLVHAGLDKRNRRLIDDVLENLAREVAERHANREYRATPKVFVLIGIHRARELDPDAYDEESVHSRLKTLAMDGPEVGIHLLAWADRKASLDRRFDSGLLREFGLRMLGRMSAEDSRSLADTEQASTITAAQQVFDNFDKALTLVVRRLGFPGTAWIAETVRAGHGRR